jgi:hypothetical protein
MAFSPLPDELFSRIRSGARGGVNVLTIAHAALPVTIESVEMKQKRSPGLVGRWIRLDVDEDEAR